MENTIIAYFLTSSSSRSIIADYVQPQYFENEIVQEIYRTLLTEYRSKPNADASVLIHTLSTDEKKYCVECCKNALLLSESISEDTLIGFVNIANSRSYNQALQNLVLSGKCSADEVNKLADKYKPVVKRSSSVDEYISKFYEKIPFYSTGFTEVDFAIGGLRAGTIMTIGARPTTGKTTFAINIAGNQPQSIKTGFFSLEMSATMIYDRLLSDKSNTLYNRILKHNMFDKENAEQLFNVLKNYKHISVYDDIYDVEDIVMQIKADKLEVAIIDYVQIVRSNLKFIDNRQRIDYISQKLKTCAKDTNCLIIVLSQLTRAGKDRPTMSDLKESGGLEQDSDYIILLHRPYVLDKTNSDLNESTTEVLLDKNKFGKTGVYELSFDGAYQRFVETSVVGPINNNDDVDDLPF